MISFQLFLLYFLAITFATLGFLKISQPKNKLAQMMQWVKYFKPATIKFIGFFEFCAALAFAGPTILGFGHKLTPYAALGISIIMALAAIFHSRRKENGMLTINLIFIALCMFVIFYK